MALPAAPRPPVAARHRCVVPGGGLMGGGLEFSGLSGAMVAMVGAVGAGALTAVYLLRRTRRRVVVPFLPLWVTAAGQSRSERFARRLRPLASYLLQLAILAFLLAAAAAPRSVAPRATGRTVVLLIDRSASMQATDESGSRLARARTLAQTSIDGLGRDDRVLVAAFGAQVTALTGMESDRARLSAAVKVIEASDETGDLGQALSFAAGLLRGQPRPTLMMIGDGAGPVQADDAQALNALPGLDFRFLPVGQRRDNLAIVGFSARRLPADPTSAELVLVTQSFRALPAEVTLSITAGTTGIPLARRRVRLEPAARLVTTLASVAVADGRLEARIEDARDDLPLDDRAYAVVPQPPVLSVLVVGRRNLYLEGALLGMGGNVRMERAEEAVAREPGTRWEKYDVVIFDGVAPAPSPEAGRFLYLDPHGPGNPWPDRGMVADPVVTDVARAHPLMKQVGLSDLNVVAARRLTLGRGDVAVVSAVGAPLIVARSREQLRQVAVAFDPRRSDLPLRSAFPLFLANALGWLSEQPPVRPLSWPTGRTIRVEWDRGSDPSRASWDPSLSSSLSPSPPDAPHSWPQVDVQSPGGRSMRVPASAGGVTLALDRVGLFTVRAPDGQPLVTVAVNLASAAESDTRPGAILAAGLRPAPSVSASSLASAPSGDATKRWDPWLMFLLVALALIAVEWVTFHRRLTV